MEKLIKFASVGPRGSSSYMDDPVPKKKERKKPSKKLLVAEILPSCRSVCSTMTLVEYKAPVPVYRGSDAPTQLRGDEIAYRFAETKDSLVLRNTFRSLFGDKHYRFRIATVLNMSSSATGAVNSVVNNSSLGLTSDFASLSAVFNEFFVVAFQVKWVPVGRYQYPLTGLSTTTVANLPLGMADLQHGQAAYTSLTNMSNNFGFGFHSTGDPFTMLWTNTEKYNKETVVTSTTAPTQSWCTSANALNYLGTLQFLTQPAPPSLPVSQLLGVFAVTWDVLFRVRE